MTFTDSQAIAFLSIASMPSAEQGPAMLALPLPQRRAVKALFDEAPRPAMRCKPGDTCLIVGDLDANRTASVEVTERVGDWGWHFKNSSRTLYSAPGVRAVNLERWVLRDCDLMPVTEAMVRGAVTAH
ncbi:hypothetical protein SRS16CHR_01792 [Variovorax sp. SRS16]|uniref:hypothetical protein n=1 Tax=Variovorax sp. SRS16 TaxID=282217 RepID=UPI001318CF98|nr:hypothetical protein [Variovorax sp. SRS16]VTU16502.1 hypothetical protein SRS16CHR_01792 [Variovorax sp. SRS16]